ncbi:MAG: potassium-transporting ATPase subunit KdpC [Anaerolineaceae bacterium]|nr:potassium-transporting ATPase subunit KdpC [Anaerolineaceae bacterium]
MRLLLRYLRGALVFLGGFTLLTGVIYPLLVTAVAQTLFPHQANGSLLEQDGVIVGSELIGQPFDDPAYFWGRPSLTQPSPYNAAASAGSTTAPSNPALTERVAARIAVLQTADPTNPLPIPVDLVTASASGLDPHISLAAAEYQVGRVAEVRGMDAAVVRNLVNEYTEPRIFGLLGEPRVHVLRLNLALDVLAAGDS